MSNENIEEFDNYEDEDEIDGIEVTEDGGEDIQEEIEEVSEDTAEQEETEEIEQIEEKPKQKISKETHALIAQKRENKQLKDTLKAIESRMAAIEKQRADESFETKRKRLQKSYVDKGFDADVAKDFAEKDIRHDRQEAEINALKKQIEGLLSSNQSIAEVKTKTEQEILYKQQKAKQAKADIGTTPPKKDVVQMTAREKAAFEIAKKSPWGNGLTAKQFLEDFRSYDR